MRQRGNIIDQGEAFGIITAGALHWRGVMEILSVNLNAPWREMMIIYRLEMSRITSK